MTRIPRQIELSLSFAPIRCVAEDSLGSADPVAVPYGSNTFSHTWINDGPAAQSIVQAITEFGDEWSLFDAHLRRHFDGVVVIEARSRLVYDVAAEDALAGEVSVLTSAGAKPTLKVRRAVPSVGVVWTETELLDLYSATVSLNAVGHPGAVTPAGVVLWFRRAVPLLSGELARVVRVSQARA